MRTLWTDVAVNRLEVVAAYAATEGAADRCPLTVWMAEPVLLRDRLDPARIPSREILDRSIAPVVGIRSQNQMRRIDA